MPRLPTLAYQRYFGTPVRAATVGGLALTETAYAPAAVLGPHRHEHAYFCLVLEGGFGEASGARERECDLFSVVYRPPAEAHRQWFSPRGGRCFNVELSARWFAEHDPVTRHADGAAALDGTPSVALAQRLYHEFRRMDALSPLAIEGLTLELLAESARARRGAAPGTRGGRAPRWLLAARDTLHAHFAEPPSVRAVAAEVGVHPGHLARTFRRAFGCSMADYVRRRRVEHACRAIALTDRPLGHVACDAGFYDQSHFTRAFKRVTTLTPAAFRATFGRRAA